MKTQQRAMPARQPERDTDARVRNVRLGLWLIVAAACLHVVEEFLLDWRSWAEQSSGLAVTWNRFWLINAAFFVFAVACAVVGARRLVLALALPCVVAINGVVFHIASTVVFRRLSPGVITSVLLWVPLAIWTIWQVRRVPGFRPAHLVWAMALAAAGTALPFVIFALT